MAYYNVNQKNTNYTDAQVQLLMHVTKSIKFEYNKKCHRENFDGFIYGPVIG